MVVTFKVLNTSTNISSSLTIKYVVVDSYTPIINVNKDNLFYIPNKQGDAVVCNPIDQYTLVMLMMQQYKVWIFYVMTLLNMLFWYRFRFC